MTMKLVKGGVTAPEGFLANGIAAGLKPSGKPDLALVYSIVPTVAAGVFTSNKMKAAPILVSMQQIKNPIQAIIANAGNANCGTGPQGLRDAWQMVQTTAEELGLEKTQVLVTSTGVIGHRLPIDKITVGIKQVAKGLSRSGGGAAASAIMTTDRIPKEISYKVKVGKSTFTIGGVAKGSGMIAPQMLPPHATMHAFITTDAAVRRTLLERLLKEAIDESFNMLTVDNEMSTNDCVFVLANGMSGIKITAAHGAKEFEEALRAICIHLTRLLALDGEGASQLLEVKVTGAKNLAEARQLAKAVAGSLLFKAAVFGGDPNFGRILAAAGSSTAAMDPAKMTVKIGTVTLFSKGRSLTANQKKAEKFLKQKTVPVFIDMGLGKGQAMAWGCELSHDYVTINAKYHT